MKLLIDIPEHIYEHAKEMTEDSRDEGEAMRAIANGSQQESRSEIPNTYGDAISRDEAVNAIYDLCGENVSLKENPLRDNPHMDAVVDALENLPSVTPQPKIGMSKWIPVSDIGRAIDYLIGEYFDVVCQNYVQKPVAYALYQTWKWADAKENPRKKEAQE